MEDQFLTVFQTKMNKAVAVLREDLATIRTGRANPEMVAHIVLRVYGGTSELELEELGTLTTEDAQTLVFVPFDQAILEEIEKGLRKANVGMAVVPEEERIWLKLPPMSAERREEFIALAHKKIEGARIMARQIRKWAMQEIENSLKNEEISEDEKFRLQKRVQEITDNIMAEIKEMGDNKEREIRTI